MLFELSNGKEFNLESICNIAHLGDGIAYDVFLNNGKYFKITRSQYLEIKCYFAQKKLNGIFVEQSKEEDAPVVNFELKSGLVESMESLDAKIKKDGAHSKGGVVGGGKISNAQGLFLQEFGRFERPMIKVHRTEKEAKEFLDKNINPSADLRVYHNDILSRGWSTIDDEKIKMFLPPVHDQQYSGHSLCKEEIENQSLDNLSKQNEDIQYLLNKKVLEKQNILMNADFVASMIIDECIENVKAGRIETKIKTDLDYKIEVIEKIKSENADCKKCANSGNDCLNCLVYNNKKFHFTNLKMTAESIEKAKSSEKISLQAELKEVKIICAVLEALKIEGFIKDYSNYQSSDAISRFTITKV